MKKLLLPTFCFLVFSFPSYSMSNDLDEERGASTVSRQRGEAAQLEMLGGRRLILAKRLHVEKKANGALVVPSPIVEFQAYPSIKVASTIRGYQQISTVEQAMVTDSSYLISKVQTVYEDIRELGETLSEQEEAENVIQFLQLIIESFPVDAEGTSYKLARDRKKKVSRICIEVDGKVVLVLVPGSKKQTVRSIQKPMIEYTESPNFLLKNGVQNSEYPFFPWDLYKDNHTDWYPFIISRVPFYMHVVIPFLKKR